jgi:hypothetical protein
MKKVLSFALMALAMGFVFTSCDKEENGGEEAAKSYTLSMALSSTDSVYLGTDKSNQYGDPAYPYYRQDITIDPFVLTHSFAGWGMGEGFTFTNCTNDTLAGSSNLSAITKAGVKTNAYFTAYTGGLGYGVAAEISFKDGAAYNAKECYVTNCVSAYLAIKDQNDGAGYVKEWTKDDKFTLIIKGFNGENETGTIEFLLADGLDIVNTWQQVDLTKLGKVTKIQFSLTTTDMISYDGGTTYYANTPLYFCLDQLTVTE